MSNTKIAFLLTTIAGLSTMFGTIPIFIKTKNINKIICSSLAFASGVMICVSITDLLPESFNMLKNYNDLIMILLVFIFLIIGIIASSLLDKFINSKENNSLYKEENNSLYKVGLISMIVIIFHNIPEGIATYISTTKNINLGLSLAVAIGIHNIPEGISISVPIYYSTSSKTKALFYTLTSALSELFGALLANFFLANYINNTVLGLLFATIAGIMIQISLSELLPTSIKYNQPKITNFFFIIGILFMLLKFFL
jgi:ZIP family zinc transporter